MLDINDMIEILTRLAGSEQDRVLLAELLGILQLGQMLKYEHDQIKSADEPPAADFKGIEYRYRSLYAKLSSYLARTRQQTTLRP